MTTTHDLISEHREHLANKPYQLIEFDALVLDWLAADAGTGKNVREHIIRKIASRESS